MSGEHPGPDDDSVVHHRSFCRICAACCGTIVTTQGAKVIRVSGDRAHPLSRGYTCAKGRAAAELHHRPDRLDYPQIRKGGELIRVGWDEALDDLALRLGEILSEGNPDAIGSYLGTHAFYEGGGLAMPDRLLHAIGSKSRYTAFTVDCPNKWLVPQLMAGRFVSPTVHFDQVSLLVYIGSNPLVSHSHGSKLPN